MFDKARKSPVYWKEMAEIERGEREILERENARLREVLEWIGDPNIHGFNPQTDAAAKVVSLSNVASDLSSPTGGASGPKAERGAGED